MIFIGLIALLSIIGIYIGAIGFVVVSALSVWAKISIVSLMVLSFLIIIAALMDK